MATIDILAALEEEFPIKRQVNVEGWPVPIWVWRLEAEHVVAIHQLPRETDADRLEFASRLIEVGIGDEDSPGVFNSQRGRAWLARHPHVQLELMQLVASFNELDAPSEDREKKLEPSADSSISAET